MLCNLSTVYLPLILLAAQIASTHEQVNLSTIQFQTATPPMVYDTMPGSIIKAISLLSMHVGLFPN